MLRFLEKKEPKTLVDEEIKGLTRIENAIDISYQQKLWKFIYEGKWDNTLKRRTQHYGYKYNYFSKKVDEKTDDLPQWSLDLCKLFVEKKWIESLPNQLIINEYVKGQGIGKHTDSPQFGPVIFSLSLGASCTMIFRHGASVKTRQLNPGMFMLIEGDARYVWTHEIERVENIRVSLTFRYVPS